MNCNGCKFFKHSESKYFDEISIYCNKYTKHLGFIKELKEIKAPKFCEVDKNE